MTKFTDSDNNSFYLQKFEDILFVTDSPEEDELQITFRGEFPVEEGVLTLEGEIRTKFLLWLEGKVEETR